MTATVARTLDVARSQLGTLEPGWGDAPGGQVTKYGRWYAAWSGMSAYADTYWCAMFVSWVLAAAGFTPTEAGRYGNCGPWIRWFKAHNMWGSTPRPGAVVFYDWDGGGADHVGLVESVRPDGRIVTLEGNASTSGTRDGVKRMVRKAYIVGYGYPPYAAPPAPVAPGGGGSSAAPGPLPHGVYGGSRKGYPEMGMGFGGADGTAAQRWWVAQWLRLLATYSPGYYARIKADPQGAREIRNLEIGPRTLYITRELGRSVIGTRQKWAFNGKVTALLWSLYPPVK